MQLLACLVQGKHPGSVMIIVLITVIRVIVSGKLKNDTYSGTTTVTTIITIGCPLIT